MDLKQVIDISSFFLVEATGDSKATVNPLVDIAKDDDDDDVQSSSYESSKVKCRDEDDDDQECIEEDGEHKYQYSGVEMSRSCKRTRLYDNAWGSMEREQNGQEKDEMSEAEKNRRFWESCLAQGYQDGHESTSSRFRSEALERRDQMRRRKRGRRD